MNPLTTNSLSSRFCGVVWSMGRRDSCTVRWAVVLRRGIKTNVRDDSLTWFLLHSAFCLPVSLFDSSVSPRRCGSDRIAFPNNLIHQPVPLQIFTSQHSLQPSLQTISKPQLNSPISVSIQSTVICLISLSRLHSLLLTVPLRTLTFVPFSVSLRFLPTATLDTVCMISETLLHDCSVPLSRVIVLDT